jgi:hypothetical protein
LLRPPHRFDTVELISAPRSFEAGGVTDTSSVFSPESTRAASKPLLIRTNPPNNASYAGSLDAAAGAPALQ